MSSRTNAAPSVGRVAVLGLGVIGRGMAGRLAGAALAPTVWNRSATSAEALIDAGAHIATTAGEAVADADIVLVSLSDDAAVRSVVESVLAHLQPGAVLVDTSTTSPETARHLATVLATRQVSFVDSPVTGGAEAAVAGTLTLLCGGSDDALAKATPALVHVSSRIVHVGDVGAGQLAKAVNQVILAGSLLGVAEGVALARRSGLDAGALMRDLQQGAAASWALTNRAAMMVEGDFEPRGRLALHLKDLRIAQQAAADVGLTLRLTDLTVELEQALTDSGHGGSDVSALVLAVDPPA
jgi:3-hydroxyisobutyrate dehydrogenase-like beta-hydroxyacid dehydrogenase